MILPWGEWRDSDPRDRIFLGLVAALLAAVGAAVLFL